MRPKSSSPLPYQVCSLFLQFGENLLLSEEKYERVHLQFIQSNLHDLQRKIVRDWLAIWNELINCGPLLYRAKLNQDEDFRKQWMYRVKLILTNRHVLTLKWLGHFFQNVISFSDAVPTFCAIFLYDTGRIQWMFSQHCGYWHSCQPLTDEIRDTYDNFQGHFGIFRDTFRDILGIFRDT